MLQSVFPHGSGAIGRPVEGVVVQGNKNTISGGVQVGLQVSVSEVDRSLERNQGVLRPQNP